MSIRVLSNIEAADLTPHFRYDRAQLVICAGRRGFGKTTFIQRYIQRREPRLFMVDPHDDFPDIQESESVLDAMRDMQRFPDACWRRVVPRFGTLSGDEMTDLGEQIFDSVNRYLRRSLVVYNEVTLWAEFMASRNLKNQIRQARRLGLKHVIDTQRFGEAPDIMRSEGSHLVLFRTTRSRDRDVLARETTPEVAEIARTLDVGQCVLVDL